jgi:hypothetical protein
MFFYAKLGCQLCTSTDKTTERLYGTTQHTCLDAVRVVAASEHLDDHVVPNVEYKVVAIPVSHRVGPQVRDLRCYPPQAFNCERPHKVMSASGTVLIERRTCTVTTGQQYLLGEP